MSATHLNSMTDKELAAWAERWAHERLPAGGNVQKVILALTQRMLRPALDAESGGRYALSSNPHVVVTGDAP